MNFETYESKIKDLNLSNINEELAAYEMLFKALKDGYSATEKQFNQTTDK